MSFLFRLISILNLFLFILVCPLASAKESKSERVQGEKYHSFETQMEDVDRVLALAKKNNKLALIVMGANWCHDSRSLARKLFSTDVSETIEDHYELLFIDVGFMERVKPVITRFGMPIIYSTPTALVVEPNTELLINRHNLHSIRDADSVSAKGINQYFNDIAKSRFELTKALSVLDPEIDKQTLSRLNQAIDEFEQYHANRIYKAYELIGPMIKEKKAGIKNKNYRKYWKSASRLRYRITADLERLREKAIKIAKNKNSKEQLVFPKYPDFAWE